MASRVRNDFPKLGNPSGEGECKPFLSRMRQNPLGINGTPVRENTKFRNLQLHIVEILRSTYKRLGHNKETFPSIVLPHLNCTFKKTEQGFLKGQGLVQIEVG